MNSTVGKLLQVFREETIGVHPRLQAFVIAQSLLPKRHSGAARARLLSLLGFRIGAGTRIEGCPRITGESALETKLEVGDNCSIAGDCVLDLSERITIGNDVTLGPGTMILTSTHEMASAQHRAGKIITAPVSVGRGAWLGARCIILPGSNVGEGAVVDPGSVVNKDVAPHTRVGGSPAVPRETLQAKGA